MNLDQLARDAGAEVRDQVAAIEAPTPGVVVRRSRRGRVATGVAAVVVLALAGVGLAVALREDSAPTRLDVTHDPEPTPTTVEPASRESLIAELYPLVAQVPGWAVPDQNDPAFTDYDYAFNGPCSGSWSAFATGGYDGGLGNGARGWNDERGVGLGGLSFRLEARASSMAARFVESLESCTATAWRTQPIARPGAVLASSANGVVWIQQEGPYVEVLQVPTTAGPPPPSVQVEVAEWMAAYIMILYEQTG